MPYRKVAVCLGTKRVMQGYKDWKGRTFHTRLGFERQRGDRNRASGQDREK